MPSRFLPRVATIAVAGLALHASSALAGQRVAVEGSPITVEVPAGWIVAPVSSSVPQLTLNLCDPLVREGCLRRGEMSVEWLLEARAPASLDAVFAQAQAAYEQALPDQRIAAPRRLTSAGRAAVESSAIGQATYDYVGGGGSTVPEGYLSVTLQDGASFYRCAAISQPDHVADLRADLIEFCNSIQINGSSSQSGQQ